MADNNEPNISNGSADSGTNDIAPRRGNRQWEVNLRNIWPSWGSGDPVAAMRRFAEEVDRRVDDAGFGPGWLNRRFGGDLGSLFRGAQGNWSPQIELFQRQDQLVVRADLPGVKKED